MSIENLTGRVGIPAGVGSGLASAMDFQQAVRAPEDVPELRGPPVPPEILDRILANARRAPSAGFSQGWAFVVLEGAEQTARVLGVHAPTSRGGTSPTGPGCCGPRRDHPPRPQAGLPRPLRRAGQGRRRARSEESAWPVPYWLVDTAFATMLMLLTAVDAGLGALFFGLAQGERELLAALGVPAGYQPIGAVALAGRRRTGRRRRSPGATGPPTRSSTAVAVVDAQTSAGQHLADRSRRSDGVGDVVVGRRLGVDDDHAGAGAAGPAAPGRPPGTRSGWSRRRGAGRSRRRPPRPGPAPGIERLAEADRGRLEDPAAAQAGRDRPRRPAPGRAPAAIGPRSPHDQHTTERIVPCSSTTSVGVEPARWCSSSMFWVTSARRRPWRSRATRARWPALGWADQAGDASRLCQAARRTSGSAR